MDISVIIVNYNTSNHLFNCLDSLYNNTLNVEFEVIVVDNCSTDRSIDSFPEKYKNTKFIFRNVNDGFGGGCNYGAGYASGKYLLFVNPDVIFESNTNLFLFRYLEDNSHIGLVSPVYKGEYGEFEYTDGSFPGYWWEISEAFGNINSRIHNRIFRSEKPVMKSPFEVNWVMGSYMLLRKRIFEKINGFDGNFFLYYEDIDLQYRIKSLGYKIFYNPLTVIKHVKRSSVRTYTGENLYYYHMTRSNLIYMYKHFGFFKRNNIRIIHLIGIIIRIITLPFRKVYRKKRKQKLSQYIIKWKQFLSGRENILNNSLLKYVPVNENQKQIILEDKFWR